MSHNKPTRRPTPTDLIDVFRRAAGVLRTNGHHQGDYFDDTAGRPPAECPACAAGCLSIVLTGHPKPPTDAAEVTGSFTARLLAMALWTLSQDVYSDTIDSDPIERIADWNDADVRTPGDVASTFLRIAWEIERERVHNAIVPTGLSTSDGTRWDLAGIGDDGLPCYVLAGAPRDSVYTAGTAELVDAHGAPSARSAL